MEKAIKLAIDGGYKLPDRVAKSEEYFIASPDGDTKSFSILFGGDILLDPLFWQALGKQQGWEEYPHLIDALAYEMEARTGIKRVGRWQKEWHKFIDHIAEGKPVDDFFNQLLK